MAYSPPGYLRPVPPAHWRLFRRMSSPPHAAPRGARSSSSRGPTRGPTASQRSFERAEWRPI
eukprot:1512987-Prymnesium_polylepis.1